MSTNGRTLASRLRVLEGVYRAPTQPCQMCKGQTWRVVFGAEPMPENACPACGSAIHVIHIAEDPAGPQ